MIPVKNIKETHVGEGMSLKSVIKYENIDPEEFIVKQDPDEETGFIANIKIEGNEELFRILEISNKKDNLCGEGRLNATQSYCSVKDKLPNQTNTSFINGFEKLSDNTLNSSQIGSLSEASCLDKTPQSENIVNSKKNCMIRVKPLSYLYNPLQNCTNKEKLAENKHFAKRSLPVQFSDTKNMNTVKRNMKTGVELNKNLSLNPVIKYKDIDPKEFIIKEDPDGDTGFIADIKIEGSEEFFRIMGINKEKEKLPREEVSNAKQPPCAAKDKLPNQVYQTNTTLIAGSQGTSDNTLNLSQPVTSCQNEATCLNNKFLEENITNSRKSCMIRIKPLSCSSDPLHSFSGKEKLATNNHFAIMYVPQSYPILALLSSANNVETVQQQNIKTDQSSKRPWMDISGDKRTPRTYQETPGSCLTWSNTLDRGSCLIWSNRVGPVRESSKPKEKSCHNITKRVKALIPQNKRFPVGEYKCYCCDKEFSLLLDWENHIISYLKFSGCYPYQENERLIWRQVLKDNVIPLPNSNKCAKCLCEFSLESMAKIINHIKYKHHKLLLKCAICPKIFKNNNKLMYHLSTLHDPTQKILKCQFCHYTSYLKSSIQSHISVKHAKEDFVKCDQCDAMLSKRMLGRHKLQKHTAFNEQKKQVCPQCDFVTKYHTHLRRHIQTKHEKGCIYFCFYCSYSAKAKYNLEYHIFSRHMSNLVVRKVKCKRCHMLFRSKHGLRIHFRSTHKEKPTSYPCQHCDTVFTEKYQSFIHMNVAHLSRNEFQCNECKYLAKDVGSLRKHVFKCHLYLYYCAHCSYTSRTKQLISLHISKHHIPVGDSFSSTHFKCTSCKYVTNSKVLLKQHMNVKHNPNPILYTCFHCGHKNKIKHKLSQHMQTKHKDLLKKSKKKH